MRLIHLEYVSGFVLNRYITDSGSFGLCWELSFVTQMADNHKHKIQSDSRKKGRIQ